jgi:hypothetical protein
VAGVTAATLRGLVIGDDPDAWEAAGFDVEEARCVVGGVTLRFVGGEGGRGILGWVLDPTVEHAIDGLPPAGAQHLEPARPVTPADGPPSSAHPNGIAAVDHLVVATPDVERTTTALGAVGVPARRTVDGARGDADIRYRFFRLGTCVLEVIGPVVPAGDGPAGFAGLAFAAGDLDRLGPSANPPRDAVQPGRRIATLRTRELRISVPVAVLTPRL